jgi:hypothetical protein
MTKKPPKMSFVLGDLQTRTMKQKEFIRHYLTGDRADPALAAKKAGYKSPEKAAHKLLKVPWIVKEITDDMEASSFRTKVTIDTVRTRLLELIEGCMQKVPVKDEEGGDTGFYKFMDASTARGAIKDLGEMVDVQAFVKNIAGSIHHTHSTLPEINIDKLSIEEQQSMLALIMKAKNAQVVEDAPKRIECEVLNDE